MTGEEIGQAAGTIWRYLDRTGAATVGQLRRGTRLPDQVLLMGLGWLCREDKLAFRPGRRAVEIVLKDRSPAA